MQLAEQIQQHIEQLPSNLQAEVLGFILALEQEHKLGTQLTEGDALAIHAKLMEQCDRAFNKLA